MIVSEKSNIDITEATIRSSAGGTVIHKVVNNNY